MENQRWERRENIFYFFIWKNDDVRGYFAAEKMSCCTYINFASI